MPPIFSSNRSRRSARSMPKFVPMPISPRRRAPSSVASARCRYSSPRSARARDDEPVAELELDARDVDAGRRGRHVEADAAVGARLVRAGEDLAAGHVALAVGVDPRAALDAQRHVGARRPRCAARARPRSRSMSVGLERAQLAPRARPGRAGRETARARRTPRSRRGSCPACWALRLRRPQRRAPALAAASARAAACGRARRGRRRSGSMPTSARVFSGAWMPSCACAFLRLGERDLGEAVEVAVAARGGERPPSRPGSSTRSSGHASRARIARWHSSSSGSASVVERTSTSWPGCDLEAVAGEQVGERRRVDRHVARPPAYARQPSASAASGSAGSAPSSSASARDERAPAARARAPTPITPIRHSLPASGPRPPEISMPWSSSSALADRGLVDVRRRRDRQQRVQLLAVGRQALAAEHRRARRAARGGRGGGAPSVARQPLVADDDPQRLAQRVDHVDRRGVVVGARALALRVGVPVAEHERRGRSTTSGPGCSRALAAWRSRARRR